MSIKWFVFVNTQITSCTIVNYSVLSTILILHFLFENEISTLLFSVLTLNTIRLYWYFSKVDLYKMYSFSLHK